MRKSVFIITVFILIFSISDVHAQGWEWARGSVAIGQEGWLVKMDASSNIFVAGQTFGDTLILGHDTIYIADPVYGADPFIAKYDLHGNLLWLRAGTGGYGTPIDIATDKWGNSFLFGASGKNPVSDSIRFGSHVFVDTLPYGKPLYYIVKYDPNGNILWAKQGGSITVSAPWACPRGIVADTFGNVYISGTFTDSLLHIGPYTLVNHSYHSSFLKYDIFLAKYDTAGNVVWAKNFGGKASEEVNGIDMTSENQIVIAGMFTSDSVLFGGHLLTKDSTVHNPGYVAKFDLNGNNIWAKKISRQPCNLQAIKVDNDDNIYLGGTELGPTFVIDTAALTCPNGCGLLIKYDSAGVFKSVKTLGSTLYSVYGGNIVYGLAVDPCNDVWVSGFVIKNIILNSTTTATIPTPTDTTDAAFLAGYDQYGSLLGYSILATGGDDNTGIVADKYGNIYLCGDNYFNAPFVLGPDTLFNGHENIFLAKYNIGSSCIEVGEPLHTLPEKAKELMVALFPNPAINECTVSISNTVFNRATIAIYDITGRLLQTRMATGNNTVISTANLAPGMYECRIDIDGRDVVYRKLVKTR